MWAARIPSCYVVEMKGGAEVRRAVEDEMDARGWRPLDAPAAADALILAGAVPDDLSAAADLLWSQFPCPRVRLEVRSPEDVARSLDSIALHLADCEQTSAGRLRPTDEAARFVGGHEEHGHGGHGGHEEHGHGGHEEHGHGGHDMRPGGVPLAGGAADRDGLEMDVLEHRWGPLLPHWPGGSEVRLVLHGDVVGDAEVVSWPDHGPVDDLALWDALSRTLTLVGDVHGAFAAREKRRLVASGEVEAEWPQRAWFVTRLARWVRWWVLPAEVAEVLSTWLVDGASPCERDLVSCLRGMDLGDARLLIVAVAGGSRPAEPGVARG